MNPILLATDGSPSAEAATREAIDLAQRLELPLLVVSVATEPTPYSPYGPYGYAEIAHEIRKTRHKHVAGLLEHVRECAADGGVSCETIELEGLAGVEICRAARSRDARLIVIGAHGWGRLGRLIHGSVSTYVLHHATMPVLVVHGDDGAGLDGDAAAVAATPVAR